MLPSWLHPTPFSKTHQKEESTLPPCRSSPPANPLRCNRRVRTPLVLWPAPARSSLTQKPTIHFHATASTQPPKSLAAIPRVRNCSTARSPSSPCCSWFIGRGGDRLGADETDPDQGADSFGKKRVAL